MEVRQELRLDPRPTTSVVVKQCIDPVTMQSLELLSLPADLLDDHLSTLAEENPFLQLEYHEDSFEEVARLTQRSKDFDGKAFAGDCCDVRSTMSKREGLSLDRFASEVAEYDTLHTHLRVQSVVFCYDEAMERINNAVIEMIDERGYFVGDLHEMSLRLCCSEDLIEKALYDIQLLSPSGVGARNLRECLLLQVERSDFVLKDQLCGILENDFFDFAWGASKKAFEKSYGLSKSDLESIRSFVQSLDPYPGDSFASPCKTEYVAPDIIIREFGHDFRVEVTGQERFTLQLDAEYQRLLADSSIDGQTRTWLLAREHDARSVLGSLDRRNSTLYRFGLYLVDAQFEFFKYGNARLRPLTMREAAEALGMHESTISRIVRDKHALTPSGVVPFKHFFTSSVGCNRVGTRSSLSSVAVKELIKELVHKEEPGKPLSDAQLTDALNNEGIDIKRRTVAKYREALGIANQARRRR